MHDYRVVNHIEGYTVARPELRSAREDVISGIRVGQIERRSDGEGIRRKRALISHNCEYPDS